MATTAPISPPPVDEKSPRTPRFSTSNPKGILNFGTPAKKPKKITKERSRHETPGSMVNKARFRASPDVVKELLVCLAKGWAPEKTPGSGDLCGVYALHQAYQNMLGGAQILEAFKFDALKQGIASDDFKTFLTDALKKQIGRSGLQGAALDAQVQQMMKEGNYGGNSLYSIEELSVFVHYMNKMYNVAYRVGVVTTQKKEIASAYIVEGDDPFSELHYRVLWIHNSDNTHWESFGPNPSAEGRRLRRHWELLKYVKKVVDNGLYRVITATQGVRDEYTLTSLTDQWVFQVAPPEGLEPRDGFIYVHTTKGPNSDSWRVVGKSTMDTIRDQEGFIPLANVEVVSSYKNPDGKKGMIEVARNPTDFPTQQRGGQTPPPPIDTEVPLTPGGTPSGPRPGGTMAPGGTLGGQKLPGEGPTPSELPGQAAACPTIELPPSPQSPGPTTRGPGTTTTQTQGPPEPPQPPTPQTPEPEIVQPIPPPTPRPKVIDLNTPLTIKTFVARRPFAATPQYPHATRGQSLGARPRLPPGRPKSRTMAEFTATRNQKNDWAQTRFLNFFLADLPDADETSKRFGASHGQPYHQDQVLLALDETYEPDVPGPVRVRTIDEDEGWAHSDNLRKVTDPFGLDLNSATTQYSMDPNEAFREDLYPTDFLRGLCKGSRVDPRGSRQEIIAGLMAHRMALGVPLILYRLTHAMDVFAKDDLVRVPGDPLAHPEKFFRAFGLEAHKRGWVRGGDLVAEPRSWGARVRPHVHELTAPWGLKWALPPDSVEDLVKAGSGLSLHGVDTPTMGEKGKEVKETEEERREREMGLAPAATMVPTRHPGQVYTAKDGSPSFFTAMPTSQTARGAKMIQPPQARQASQTTRASQTGRVSQTAQTAQTTQNSPSKRGAEEDAGGDVARRRVSQR